MSDVGPSVTLSTVTATKYRAGWFVCVCVLMLVFPERGKDMLCCVVLPHSALHHSQELVLLVKIQASSLQCI